MYSRCAVLGCPNKAGHRFPKNEVVRKKWIEVMKLDHQRNIGWHLSSGSSICSHHFELSDYDVKYDSNGVQVYRKLKNHAIPSIFPWPTSKKPTFDANQVTKRGTVQQFKRLKNHATPSISPSPIFKEPTFDSSQVTKTYSRKKRPLAFVPEIAFMDSTTCDNTEIDPLLTDVEIKIETSVDNDDSLQYIVQENMSFDVYIINNIDKCLNATPLPKQEEVDSNELRIKSEITTESDSNDIRIKSEITGETDSDENIIKSEITAESDSNDIRIKSEIAGETNFNEHIIKSEITAEIDSNEIRIKSEITGEPNFNEHIIKSEITAESDSNEIGIKSEITIPKVILMKSE